MFELELEHGLQDVHCDQCIVIERNMPEMHAHLDDMNAGMYVDVTAYKQTPQVNWEAQNQLLTIKSDLIPQKVDSSTCTVIYVSLLI
mgnify:CR=1 FL=1